MIDATLGEVWKAVDRFPALRESNQHLREVARQRGDARELVAAVEADPALTLAVLRLVNRKPAAGSVMSVREA
jgi:c-di-GMP-related signal transduction protein